MEYNELIKKRTSTRKFSNKEVEKDKINKILESGRLAPTAKNIQPIKIYVVTKDNLSKIDASTPCRYNAQTVLIICGDKEESYVKDGHPIYDIDASIVTTHMMLEATNLGVDNIWIEYFDSKILKKEFKIPENLDPVALLPIGYKDENCPISPMHNKRKSLEELVEWR